MVLAAGKRERVKALSLTSFYVYVPLPVSGSIKDILVEAFTVTVLQSVDGWLHASPSGTPSTVTGETSISVIFLMLVSLGRHRFVPF